MVTVCGDEYVPLPGEMTGVAACVGWLMVMTEVAVVLCRKLGAVAIALTVVVLLTVNEPAY